MNAPSPAHDDAVADAPHIEDAAHVFMAVFETKGLCGFAVYDRDANALSLVQGVSESEIDDTDEGIKSFVARTAQADVVYCSSETKDELAELCQNATVIDIPKRLFSKPIDAMNALCEIGGFANRGDLTSCIECAGNDAALSASGALICALQNNEALALALAGAPVTIQEFAIRQYLNIDQESLSAIGVFVPEKYRAVSAPCKRFGKDVYQIFLDSIATIGGKKLLRQWFNRPLLNMDVLQERRDCVEHLINSGYIRILRKRMTSALNAHFILAKIAGDDHVVMKSTDDWKRLFKFLNAVSSLYDTVCEMYCDDKSKSLSACNIPAAFADFIECVEYRLPKLKSMTERVIDVNEIYALTEHDSAIFTSYVRAGVCPELDELRSVYHGLPSLLERVFQAEMERLPRFLRRPELHKQLCVEYLPQTGYLIKSTGGPVPVALLDELGWRLAFTDVGDMFFYEFDAGLRLAREIGDILLSIVDLQEQLLRELRTEILSHSSLFRDVSRCISEIDVLLSFADVAVNFNMVRPTLIDDDSLHITGGRHLLYETFIEHPFVPNDIEFPPHEKGISRVLIITGPNGSGKTCVLQTIGLIIYLAHVGSFVPATTATVGLTDRLFTGMIGFNDDPDEKAKIPEGSFTHALNRVARMVNNATNRSTCLVDEFGIETRSDDGAALLAAIVEHFAKLPKPPKVAFTTHFREICDPSYIGETLPFVSNMRMRAIVNSTGTRVGEDVAMTFILEPGVADSSFALNMCRLAGMDEEFMRRLEYHVDRGERAARGEELEPYDFYGDPNQEEKFKVFNAIHERIEALRARGVTEENVDDFLAWFDDAISLDKFYVPTFKNPAPPADTT